MKIQQLVITSDKEKLLFIARLSKEGRQLLIRCDEPASEYPELKGKASEITAREYLVKPPYTYELLEHWLSFGNWQAVFPPRAGFSAGNTFKRSFRVIEQKMRESRVEVLIDSSEDNIEWNIFLSV